jgi:hypothetical protein
MIGLALLLTMQKQVSLCEVLRRPAKYQHSVLGIRAEILVALPHGAVLVNKSCPKAGLRLGVDLPDADGSATNLGWAVMNDCSEPRQNTVPGIFIGKLAYSTEGHLELRLLSVKDLEVHSCTELKPLPPMVTPSKLQ